MTSLQRCAALIASLLAGCMPALAAQASAPGAPQAYSVAQAEKGVYSTSGSDDAARRDRKGSYKSLSTRGGSQGAPNEPAAKVLRTPPAVDNDARRDSGRAVQENYSLGGFISISRCFELQGHGGAKRDAWRCEDSTAVDGRAPVRY